MGARRRSRIQHIAPDAHNKQRCRKHDASHSVRTNVAASLKKDKATPSDLLFGLFILYTTHKHTRWLFLNLEPSLIDDAVSSQVVQLVAQRF